MDENNYRILEFKGLKSVDLYSNITMLLIASMMSPIFVTKFKIGDVKTPEEYFSKLLENKEDEIATAVFLYLSPDDKFFSSILKFGYDINNDQNCFDLKDTYSYDEILLISKKILIKFIENLKTTTFLKGLKITSIYKKNTQKS